MFTHQRSSVHYSANKTFSLKPQILDKVAELSLHVKDNLVSRPVNDYVKSVLSDCDGP